MNLQEFIEVGAKFFTGESSLKTELAKAQAEVTSLTARVATLQTELTAGLEAVHVANQVATTKAIEQTAALATVQASLDAKIAEVATLKADTQPGRMAARVLATAGVDPVSPAAPSDPAVKDFPALVAAQMVAGKSKSAAISAVVSSNPDEYRTWLKTGGAI